MVFICVGEIVNVIGLKGEVKLYPLMDYFDELLDSPYVVGELQHHKYIA